MGNPCSAHQNEDLEITRPPPCPIHEMMSSRHKCHHCDECLKWKAGQTNPARNMERRPDRFEQLASPLASPDMRGFQGRPMPPHGYKGPNPSMRQMPPRPPMHQMSPMPGRQMPSMPGHQAHGMSGQMPPHMNMSGQIPPMQRPPQMRGHQMGSPAQRAQPEQYNPMLPAVPSHQMAPPHQMAPAHQMPPAHQMAPAHQMPPAHQMAPSHLKAPPHQMPPPQEPKVKVIEVMEPSAPPCQVGPIVEFEDDAPPEIVYEHPAQRSQPAQEFEAGPKGVMYEERREDPRQYREMMRR